MAHGILVPLDGSALAARALPYATRLAERCGAALLLAEIVAPTPRAGEDAAEARDRAFAEAAERLAARQQPLPTRGLAVEALTEGGDPAGALMDIVRARDVALIVMATHGRSGPARWVLGSVAARRSPPFRPTCSPTSSFVHYGARRNGGYSSVTSQ